MKITITSKKRDENAWAKLKEERNRLLKDTDWTQVPDSPVDKAVWATYRQSLRDMTKTTQDPYNPVWPTQPKG